MNKIKRKELINFIEITCKSDFITTINEPTLLLFKHEYNDNMFIQVDYFYSNNTYSLIYNTNGIYSERIDNIKDVRIIKNYIKELI